MLNRIVLSFALIFSQARLTAASSSAPELQWFKTVGGTGTTTAAAVASDGHGNLYIAGTTTALDFPAVAAAQPHAGGSPLIRITLSSGASQKIYSPALAQATSVTVDPANSQVLYAGSNAGLSRSTNGGATWTALAGFPAVDNFDSVAVDPTNSKILYAATQPLGVLKSTDAGVTWSAMNNGIPTISENNVKTWDTFHIWVDPQVPSLIFVSVPSGLVRSGDGAMSWAESPVPDYLSGPLAADPFTKGTIYAPTFGSFYKSADSGVTWAALAVLPDGSHPSAIAADPIHAGTLYGGSNTGLFQSTDSGQTWTQKVNGATTQFATDPSRAVIYANVTGLGIVSSTDGFTTYKPIATANSSVQLEVAGPYLFAVAPPSSDVFVTKLDSNGNILYSTYFGGSGADNAAGMALGSDGSIYVTGTTNSTDFPVTTGAYASSGTSFVFKLNPDGSKAWSTYFADVNSTPYAIAVDAAGSPYIGGQTSGDLPVTPGAYETTFTPTGCPPGNIGPCFIPSSGFLTKLNLLGSSLVFSTYIFQNQQEQLIQSVNAITPSPNGDVYFSSGFGSLVASASGVYLMSASGGALLAANTSESVNINAIVLGKDGNLYATGSTAGPFAATSSAFQRFPQPPIPSLPDTIEPGGGNDAFVLKFDGSLSNVLAATLLGGEGVDYGSSIALDASGNVIISGYTASTAFPVRAPFQGSFSDNSGFVAGLDSNLSQLLFSTYLGDTRPFLVQGAVPDGNGNLLIAGSTQFPNPAVDTALAPTVIVNKIALPPVPAVRLDSVVNYASRLAVPLSPGEAVEVIGAGFGPDAKLLLDGNPVPILFANGDRIVAVIPADAKTSGSVQVTVSNNGVRSNLVNVPVALASPGIYSVDNTGFGQGYILNSDGTRNSQTNPAAVGSAITILATGVGPLSQVGIYSVTEQPVAIFVDGFYANGIAAVTKHVAGLPGEVYEISVTITDPATLVQQNPDLKNFQYPPEVAVTLSMGTAQSQQGIALWIKQN